MARAQLVLIVIPLQAAAAIMTEEVAEPSAAVKEATAKRYAVLFTGPPISTASIAPITIPSKIELVPLKFSNPLVKKLFKGSTNALTAS